MQDEDKRRARSLQRDSRASDGRGMGSSACESQSLAPKALTQRGRADADEAPRDGSAFSRAAHNSQRGE
eukprot:6204342-Pleurochrysis_carterae.AAC.10